MCKNVYRMEKIRCIETSKRPACRRRGQMRVEPVRTEQPVQRRAGRF